MTARAADWPGCGPVPDQASPDAPCGLLAHQLLRAVEATPPDGLPALMGALAQAHALAIARLVKLAERQEDAGEDRLLTMPEVSERLGITEHQARELGRRGELPTIIVGERHVRVRRLALEEWVRRRETGRMIRHGRT